MSIFTLLEEEAPSLQFYLGEKPKAVQKDQMTNTLEERKVSPLTHARPTRAYHWNPTHTPNARINEHLPAFSDFT